MKRIFLALSLLALISCGQDKEPKEVTVEETKQFDTVDVHSFAKRWEARVQHLDLDINVDFDAKQISGFAEWTLSENPTADSIFFDLDEIEIKNVWADGQETKWTVGETDPVKGQPLVVHFPEGTQKIKIEYVTAPSAAALQWLDPQQTHDKKHPFLFTQSQAILARTWIPCQDSPGIRYTYNAKVTVPKGMMALMSASNPQEVDPDGVYEFEMPQPIPSYLMALSVGDIAFASMGERTGVYAEPGMLEASAYEFADTEKMLEAAEALYGAYAWGRYDLIVLPPSFPFGGMENPRLTFVTPTVVAGDRSLTSLIAHELAHSWSGNLVTNDTWNDFWVNEGFTVYFERRIMESLYGRDYSEMLATLGHQDLEETVADLPKEDTHLKLDLKGRNPDDGLTDVAYEKGYFFLRLLEETYGREKFDTFLKNYFQSNAFKTMTTEKFMAILDSNLLATDSTLIASVNPEEWVYGPGLPNNCPRVTSERFQRVNSTLKAWADGAFSFDEMETSDWSSHEWLHFVRHLPDTLSLDRLAVLDEHFHFTTTGNSEVQAAWLTYSIQKGYEPAFPAAEEFLIRVGRRKFLTPLYKALIAEDPTKEKARAIYKKARPNYHSVSQETIDAMLK